MTRFGYVSLPTLTRLAASVINPNLDSMLFPRDSVVECQVLGAVIAGPQLLGVLATILEPEDFILLKHNELWRCLLALFDTGIVISEGAILEWFEINPPASLKSAGNLAEIIDTTINNCLGGATFPEDVERAAWQIRSYALRRNMLELSDAIRSIALDETLSADERLADVEATTNDKLRRVKPHVKSIKEMLLQVSQSLEDVEQGRSVGLPMVQTTFPKIDEAAGGGIHRAEITVLGGSAGDGKSRLTLSLARAAALNGANIMYFPTEMTQEQIVLMLIQMGSGIPIEKLATYSGLSDVEHVAYESAQLELANLSIHIVERHTAMTPAFIRREMMNVMAHHVIDIVFIDGLWLVRPDKGKQQAYQSDNSNMAFGSIMDALSNISRQAVVPLFLTHQLKRAVQERKDKMPTRFDLAYASEIERFTENVWLMHRGDDNGLGETTGLIFDKIRLSSRQRNQRVELGYDERRGLYMPMGKPFPQPLLRDGSKE